MSEPRIYRPDPRYKVVLVVNTLLVFLVFIAPFALLALAPGLGGTFLLWFLMGNAAWIAAALGIIRPYVRSIEYELGDHEVIVRRGIIVRSTDLVPYSMITNVTLRRGPVARALGLGTLNIHTAGFSQNAAAEARVVGVAEYDALREAIVCAMHSASASKAPLRAAGSQPLVAPGAAEVELLGALLEEVRGLRADLKH